MRLRCYECGKTVSTEIDDEAIVRAVLFCPECLEKMAKEGRLKLLRRSLPKKFEEKFAGWLADSLPSEIKNEGKPKDAA